MSFKARLRQIGINFIALMINFSLYYLCIIISLELTLRDYLLRDWFTSIMNNPFCNRILMEHIYII